MSRLIVLSNRVKLPDNGPMAGGLAVALNDVLEGRSVIWMGWNGEIVDNYKDGNNEFSQQETSIANDIQKADTKITYMTTALTSKQYQHYYCGFANSVLWLLLHEQPNLVSQAPDDYAGYQEVNRLFAKQLKAIAKPDDVIWVHDYHFLSVAYHCRQLGMSNRIGFFLHIPFAPLSLWQSLEQSLELIHHLAHYDVLGTQTEHDRANCLSVLQHYLQHTILSSEQNIAHSKRSVGVQLKLDLNLATPHYLTLNTYPIGVNVARIQQQVSGLPSPLRADKQAQTDAIKPAAQQIIAVDRIDYSKGLLERFSAYRTFLQQNTKYQDQLKFLQIACPSRLDLPVYQQLYDKVKQTVDNINQQFLPNECHHECVDKHQKNGFKTNELDVNDFSNDWQAITYSEKVLCHDKLMTAFYRSDVGWVNSLKDGMNLVAKEYIAAQNPDNPGVLLLSRYAGAAEQMQAAVIIDPHQPTSIIQGLETALSMPLAKRKSRYQTLLQGLQNYDIHVWQQHFLEDLYHSKNVEPLTGTQALSKCLTYENNQEVL